jgi:carbohydrate-selective porin OprB
MLKFLTGCLCILSCSATFSADSLSHVKWNGYIRADGIENIHGGIKTGATLLGSAKLVGTYEDVLQLGFIGATHTKPESTFVGSVQLVTSLDVQREIRLSNLSFLYHFSPNLSGRFGVMDMEDFYDITESAVDLRNSAFVNGMALDKTTQLASFPYPGFGGLIAYTQAENYFYLGIYQGNPEHLNTVFSRGYMLIAEGRTIIPLNYEYAADLSLKLGLWLYNPKSIPGYTNARGIYLIAQNEWQYAHHPMEGFLQLSYSHESPKTFPFSLTIGARGHNIFCNNKTDALSVGIAEVWINNRPNEIVFEVAYAFRFYKGFCLNPDLQYFFKPSGIYPNATVFLLRLSYNF